MTTPVTSSTPAYASIGSAPCSTSISATLPLVTKTRRRPSGATDVARARYSSNQVVASCEWMTSDVAGALGAGGGTHVTTANATAQRVTTRIKSSKEKFTARVCPSGCTTSSVILQKPQRRLQLASRTEGSK